MMPISHGPYDQLESEMKPTTVSSLVANSHEGLAELHKSLDNLGQRLETVLNRSDVGVDLDTKEDVFPTTSLMCGELLKLNDGIDSAARRVNTLMARLEL